MPRRAGGSRASRLFGPLGAQPRPAVLATNSATSSACSPERMPPGIRPGVRAAVDAFFDRVEDAAFGRFDRFLGGGAGWRPGRGQQFVEVGPEVAVGARRVERVAGAAVRLEEALPGFRSAETSSRAPRRVAVGAEDEPRDQDREDEDQRGRRR